MFQSTADTQLETFLFYSYVRKRSQCVVTWLFRSSGFEIEVSNGRWNLFAELRQSENFPLR